MSTLAALEKGHKAFISQLLDTTNSGNNAILRRLTQLGFIVNTPIEILHEGFWGKDPISVKVGNHTIAIRRSEAELIAIKENLE